MGTERQTLLDVPADYLHLTEDDLPSSDGIPMETQRHYAQMVLLIQSLKDYWKERQDCYVAGDMFVYFSPHQVKNEDFRGPDVFAVQGVSKRERKSWVVWQEGKSPDVVIELMSESTATFDKCGETCPVARTILHSPFSILHYSPGPMTDTGNQECP